MTGLQERLPLIDQCRPGVLHALAFSTTAGQGTSAKERKDAQQRNGFHGLQSYKAKAEAEDYDTLFAEFERAWEAGDIDSLFADLDQAWAEAKRKRKSRRS